MTVAELNSDRPIMAEPPVREHVVLYGITWETYRRLRAECVRLHIKMTFDRGTLEIMSPRADHAFVTRFFDQMVSILSDELRIRITGYRDTTWNKIALDRGLEADECYYVANSPLADQRGVSINLDRDPPPDLAVETDITHSTIDKEAIYAALGVPELWRWDNGIVRIRLLGSDGRYADADRSIAFPMLGPEVIQQFVSLRMREGEWDAKEAFRAWVRAYRANRRD
jgi:Uma2 family endonuclease